jgi:replicative DNA helicase
MSTFNNVVQQIEAGQKGENTGLSMGFKTLVDYIPNLQKDNLYLIGGETGSGKSALAYNHFLYHPYEDWKANYSNTIKFKAFVWSIEMSKEIVITKAICRKIFQKYKILVDVNYVLSRGKNRISTEIYTLVNETKDWFEEFEDRVILLPNENPTGIYHTLRNYLLENGKVFTKDIKVKGEDGNPKIIQGFDYYKPYFHDMYLIAMIDHAALVKKERGFTKKETIDKTIEYMIDLRNKYKIIPVIVQQLNRNISSTDRFKQGRIGPQLDDFKESGDTTDAANYVLALFSPMRYELNSFKGYNIQLLRDRFRTLNILKTRDGEANISKGLGFLGEIGIFTELVKGDQMTEEMYREIINYKKYTK